MEFDWKKMVGALAPTLGTALLGPLAGSAIKILADAVLGNPDASADEVGAAIVQGLTPEAVVKLREVDNAFKVQMRSMEIDLAKLNQAGELAYVADVQNARMAHAGDKGVFRLGIVILSIFAIVMVAVLWGSFAMMNGTLQVDPGVAAMVAGLVGTVTGYVAANAQQVTGYFFGSSRGSADKTDRMATQMADTLRQLGGPKP